MTIPTWATKHKKKGTILRKKDNQSYYLIRAYSKRVAGKRYPVLVQDEIIATITADGITYQLNKLVDITKVKVVSFSNTHIFWGLPVSSQNKLSQCLLFSVKEKWYFANLDNTLITLLEDNGIDPYKGVSLDEND